MKASNIWIAAIVLIQALSLETIANSEHKPKNQSAQTETNKQASPSDHSDNPTDVLNIPETPHSEPKASDDEGSSANNKDNVIKAGKPSNNNDDQQDLINAKNVSNNKQVPVTPPPFSNKIEFDFMHTKQDCKVVEGTLQHKPTFCTIEDTKAATELSGMVQNISNQLDSVKEKASTAKISIAYFSFSNKGIQKKLCELSKAGVQIRVFLDNGSRGQIDELITANPECNDSKGKNNVKLSYLGGHTDGEAGGIWRLHHNKFMMIDPGNNEKVKFNFSSGNLSTFGTSLHLDHWVMMEAPSNSNIIQAQRCVMEGLEAASMIQENQGSNPPTDAANLDNQITQGYIYTRESCFNKNNVLPRVSGKDIDSQISQILNSEEIAPLFSPNNNAYVEKSFINAIRRIPSKGYLYIAIQHFLHFGVKQALIDAANNGVDVRLIMDDDALKGQSEVPGVDKMIDELLLQSGGRIQVRLAETNHNAGGNGAMMHNKLAILNGNMTFSGAGHYTYAALRDNWENFYFVTNKKVITNYAQYFKYLWSQSVDIAYTKSNGQTPSKDPSTLNEEFLKLAP